MPHYLLFLLQTLVPLLNEFPSMIIASHSISRSLFNNDPVPLLKYSLSSKTRTAASTASTALPPSYESIEYNNSMLGEINYTDTRIPI